jgi:hypothetical protein
VPEKRPGSQHPSGEEIPMRQAPLDTDGEWRRKNRELNDSHGAPEEEEEEEEEERRGGRRGRRSGRRGGVEVIGAGPASSRQTKVPRRRIGSRAER